MCVGVGWVVLVEEGGGGVGCSGSIRPNMCKPVACVLFRLFRASMVGAFSVFLGFWVLFYEFFVCVSFCFDGDFAVGLNCWLSTTW